MPDYSLAVEAGLVKKNPSRGNLPFRPTSDCFLIYKGKLVAQDTGHYLAFPGGGVDPGEEPIEAATRELMEEVGAILKEPMKSLENNLGMESSGLIHQSAKSDTNNSRAIYTSLQEK